MHSLRTLNIEEVTKKRVILKTFGGFVEKLTSITESVMKSVKL